MSGSPTFEGLTAQALEQHRQIHFFLDRVEQTLSALVDGMADVEPLRRLAAELEGLKERLLEHHQAEERGGLFQAMQDALPACRVEIERLTGEHGRMIEVLEMARLHALGNDVSEAASLREDLKGFLETFRAHEREEERLFERVLDHDSRIVD